MCDDCTHEIENPRSRRFRYAFTSCSRCGPRYALARTFPHDRSRSACRASGCARSAWRNTTVPKILDAQRQNQQASLGYVRAQAQRYAETIQLQIALGGASLEALSVP